MPLPSTHLGCACHCHVWPPAEPPLLLLPAEMVGAPLAGRGRAPGWEAASVGELRSEGAAAWSPRAGGSPGDSAAGSGCCQEPKSEGAARQPCSSASRPKPQTHSSACEERAASSPLPHRLVAGAAGALAVVPSGGRPQRCTCCGHAGSMLAAANGEADGRAGAHAT